MTLDGAKCAHYFSTQGCSFGSTAETVALGANMDIVSIRYGDDQEERKGRVRREEKVDINMTRLFFEIAFNLLVPVSLCRVQDSIFYTSHNRQADVSLPPARFNNHIYVYE